MNNGITMFGFCNLTRKSCIHVLRNSKIHFQEAIKQAKLQQDFNVNLIAINRSITLLFQLL